MLLLSIVGLLALFVVGASMLPTTKPEQPAQPAPVATPESIVPQPTPQVASRGWQPGDNPYLPGGPLYGVPQKDVTCETAASKAASCADARRFLDEGRITPGQWAAWVAGIDTLPTCR